MFATSFREGRRWLLVTALALCACSSEKSGPGGTVGLDAGSAGGSGGSGAGGTTGGTGVAGSGGAAGSTAGTGGAGAGGTSGTGGSAGGAGGAAGGTGGTGGSTALGCLELLMCIAPCAEGNDACIARCLDMGSPQGKQNLLNLASCSDRFMCADDPCLERNCAAELRDCAGGGASGPPTRERLIGKWWNSPTGNLYNWYTFTQQGQFSFMAATGRTEMGPFTVQGDQLTLMPDGGTPRRYTFGFECVGGEALLNLTDGGGLKVGYWRHVDSPGGKTGGFCL